MAENSGHVPSFPVEPPELTPEEIATINRRAAEMRERKEQYKDCKHPHAKADILDLGKPDRYCPDCWEWALDGVFANER